MRRCKSPNVVASTTQRNWVDEHDEHDQNDKYDEHDQIDEHEHDEHSHEPSTYRVLWGC